MTTNKNHQLRVLLPVIRLTYSCVCSGGCREGRRGEGEERYRLISCRPNSERVSRLPTGFNNRCLESTVCKFISPPYYRGRLSFLYLRINEVFLPTIIGYGTAITAAVYGNFCLTLKGDVPRSKTQKYGICPGHFSRGSENSSKNAFARGANIPTQ